MPLYTNFHHPAEVFTGDKGGDSEHQGHSNSAVREWGCPSLPAAQVSRVSQEATFLKSVFWLCTISLQISLQFSFSHVACRCAPTSRTAAVTLERDCYQKYGKAGRSFYNSQVASTIRWLGSCSTEDLLSRVPTDEAKSNVCNTDQDLVTGLVPPSVGGGDVLSPQPVPAHALHPEMESNSRTSVDKLERIALPRIPSMSEFVKRTRTMSTEPSDASARNSKKARLRSE